MAFSLQKISNWLWGANSKSGDVSAVGITSFPNFTFGFLEPDSVKLPQPPKRPRKIKKRQKDRRDHKEYDMVIVQSDEGCFSGEESDDSDWSIGWLEPHAEEFVSSSEGDWDPSFAVLVRCYGRKPREPRSPKNRFRLTANHQNNFTDGKNYVEQWVSSLQHPWQHELKTAAAIN